MGGRLYSLRPALTLGGWSLGAVLAMAAVFVYRVAEIPSAGEPFDVQAFEDSLPTPEQNEAGRRIRAALQELLRQQEASDNVLIFRGWLNDPDVLSQVVAQEWRKPDPHAEQLFNEVFGWKWADELSEAVALPLGVIVDPRNVARSHEPPDGRLSRYAGSLFLARALVLQARGEREAAFDHLVTALALARHLENHAIPQSFQVGTILERYEMDALGHWLERLGRRPQLVRRALEALNKHEAERSPLAEAVRAEYLVRREALNNPWLVPNTTFQTQHTSFAEVWGDAISVTSQAPWEKARRQRILNAVFAGSLRAVVAGYHEVGPIERPEEQARHSLDVWLPAKEGPETPLTRERLEGLLDESGLWSILPDWRQLFLANTITLGRIRAAKLKLALLLFEAEKGRLPASLDELVPDFLPAVPLDPFSGQRFHYRVSRGEKFQPQRRTDRPEQDVSPGQAIFWSVGPDGIDHGGTKQGDDRTMHNSAWWSEREWDWIFLVPRWPEK